MNECQYKYGENQNKNQGREKFLSYLLIYLVVGIKIDKIICIFIEDCIIYVEIK